MSQTSGVSALDLCLKTEEAIAVIADRNIIPENVEVQDFGAWQAINRAQNGMSLQQLTGGKSRPSAGAGDRDVQIYFTQPDCGDGLTEASDVVMDCTDLSDAIETKAQDRFSVDQFVGAQFAIDASYFTGNCYDLAVDLNQKLRAAARKMIKAENDYAIDWLYANAGNYFAQSGETAVASTTTPYTLAVLDASFKPQPLGFLPLVNQYDDMGIDGDPFIVSGSGYLRGYSWADTKGIFGLGADDGVDPSTVTAPNFFYDKRTDVRVNANGGPAANNILTFAPGGVANVPWFEYDNPEQATTPDGRKAWLPFAIGGRVVRQVIDIGAPFGVFYPVDAFIFYDDCNNKVIYKFQRYYDYWRIPDEAFVTACDQQHNYILLWTAGAEALDANDFNPIVA